MQNYLASIHFAKWQRKSKWRWIKVALVANVLHVFLLVLGYKRLMKCLSFFQRKAKVQYQIAEKAQIKLLKKAVNPIFKKIRKSKLLWANCFSTSILLWYLLKQEGLDTEIIIGTKREEGKFKAHAWVEYKSYPINENQKIREKYAVFEHDFSDSRFFITN